MEAAAASDIDRLPEDVLRVVLSHLPCPWLLQSRVVCKQWNHILRSSHFALQWAQRLNPPLPSPHSLCLLLLLLPTPPPHSPLHLSAFHLSTLLSIPLSPPPPPPPPPLSSLPPPPPPPLPLASSPLGILFSSPSPSSLPLFLFHPLSRHSLPLPPPPLIRLPLSASFAPLHPGFHILLLGAQSNNPADPLAVEMYTSTNSSWTTLPCLPNPRNTTRIPRSTHSLVWWRNAFYMLWGNSIRTVTPHTMKAAAENADTTWGNIELPTDPRIWDTRFITLHVVKDRLFLEGNFQEQGDFQRRYPLRIRMVEYDTAVRKWREMGCMPEAMSKRLCKQQQHPAHCFYTAYSDPHADHIYFVPFGTGMEETGIELVRFDVDHSSWSSIPDVPFNPALLASPTFKGLTFHVLM